MLRNILIGVVFLIITPAALAVTDAEGYNEYTIRPSHIPADAPRFEDYPVEMYGGANAAPDLRSNPTSKLFKTRLKEWAKEKPNFAGHFILATWGCGTDCTQITIIDAQSGNIYYPERATVNEAVNVHASLLNPSADIWHGSGAIWYKGNSRLLVLIGMPEEQVENRGISYFLWEENKLKRIRFIPTGWYPDDK